MSTQLKIPKQPKLVQKTISITLSVEDLEYINRISKEFGLIKATDCLRLAVREAVRHIDARRPVVI